MKVKLYITSKKHRVDFIGDYASTLKANFDVVGDLCDADILLVLGIWDPAASRWARRARKMGVPYVVIPLGDLSAWNTRTPIVRRTAQTLLFANPLVRHAQGLVATNQAEKKRLDDIRWNRHVTLITDYLFSSATTLEAMVAEYLSMADKTLADYDAKTRKRIWSRVEDIAQNHDDTPEKTLLFQLLLVRNRMPHKNIPPDELEKTYNLLMADNYDEDLLNHLVHRARLDAFAASLWQVLGQRHALGEGFMPSPPKKGRLAQKIASYVKPRPTLTHRGQAIG